jgi:L-ascorbate metabolism protein UlaG (beta-lactamase superfamily)
MHSNEKLYLRQNVQVEPLVDHWYAWSHLIPPATAARNLTDRHMKIMNSYISSPQIHAAAVRNPKMLGGPFIDYQGKRVDEIKALRDRMVRERAGLFELSAALAELDSLLQDSAKGSSLHPLYQRVPAALRGYVELVYDLNHHPSYRLLEPLLYKSPFYEKSAQSIMLSLVTGDDRPFVLSTPRLEGDGLLNLPLSFDNPVIDQLFRLKTHPKTWGEICEMLNPPKEKEQLLRSFFHEEPPLPYAPYEGDGARWRYFGHACILVEQDGFNVLMDPVLSYTYESNISRYTYEDLPDVIDYVLITHNHQDHLLFETILQLRHKIRNIVVPRNGGGALQDPSMRLLLQQCGFQNVIEITEMEKVATEKGSITALPFFGEHADLNVQTKLAYLIEIAGHKLLFAADSCNVEPSLYKHIHREIGDVDALFLGMECDGAPLSWLYGPLITRKLERSLDESRRLSGSNCEQGMQIVNEFHCGEVYVYAMGQEPWLNYVMSIKYTDESHPIVESNKLLEECRQRGLCAERLFGEKEILLNSVYATT